MNTILNKTMYAITDTQKYTYLQSINLCIDVYTWYNTWNKLHINIYIKH